MRSLLLLSAAGLVAVLVMTAAAVNTGSAADEPLSGGSGAVFAGQVTDSPTPTATAVATTAAATTAAATTAAAGTATPAAIPETGGSPNSGGGVSLATYLLLAIGALALAGGAFAVARAGRTH